MPRAWWLSTLFVYLNPMDYLWTPWRYAYLVDADPNSPKGGRKGVPPALAALAR